MQQPTPSSNVQNYILSVTIFLCLATILLFVYGVTGPASIGRRCEKVVSAGYEYKKGEAERAKLFIACMEASKDQGGK